MIVSLYLLVGMILQYIGIAYGRHNGKTMLFEILNE